MYQPRTGAKCSCKRGVMRDNCSTCEGTGWVIDFRAIRNRAMLSDHCDSVIPGTEGQDRENYTDTQDREFYTVDETWDNSEPTLL